MGKLGSGVKVGHPHLREELFMKTELKAKFIQHLNQKKQDQGFTLIELLVVIIIIGILSAIALPSFLNQANKAKQSEAKQYVGSMNRAQQARFLEAGELTTNIATLGLGIATATTNYQYDIKGNTQSPNPAPDGEGWIEATNRAEALKPVLKHYLGGVGTGTTTGQAGGEATTLAVLCESKGPATEVPIADSVAFQAPAQPGCPADYDTLE